MTEKQKMLAGELYNASDETLVAERASARLICRTYNKTTEEMLKVRTDMLRDLLGGCGKNIQIESDFKCDYGYNIFVGENFYANFDLTVLDVCPVRIGDNCLIGPRVTLCTATHPIDAATRLRGLELGKPITIGNNVWIGAGAIINPGVTLGDNVVVAAGAVVTQSFGDNVIIGGVPAHELSKDSPCQSVSR
ncbi:MAG: sugar O-acetyltransferase [Kiritimatiellae bacterium]|nr:sugar O-acetyltransferase [Kiritimatiellia bacterium]